MFLNFDYIFVPLVCVCVCVCVLCVCEVELEISFCTYFIRHTCGLTPFHLNKRKTENEKTSPG